MKCPYCGRTHYGTPIVITPGERYRYVCRPCCNSWDVDGNGERITEKGTDTDGREREEAARRFESRVSGSGARASGQGE